MGKAVIFISHSTKDDEPPPPAETDATATNRWRRLCLARELRWAIERELIGLGTVRVWLDQRQIEVGDAWRDAVHEALACCDGAVLLLTPEALKSGWVLKEATILTWLHALGFPIKIVPVLLGVSVADLARHGFGPLGIDEIEAYRIVADDLEPHDDAAIAAEAVAVSELFCDTIANAAQTDLDLWVTALTANWGDIGRPYVRKMMTVLKMSEGAWSDRSFDALRRPAQTVACELLLRTWMDAIDALGELARLPVQWKGVKKLVLPLWVPAAAAKVVPLVAARPPGERVVLVNGTEPHTGRAVVQRAYFGSIDPTRLHCPDDAASSEENLIAMLRELMRRTRVLKPNHVTSRQPYFMVLGSGAASPQVLNTLRTTAGFDVVTYVVMVPYEDRGPFLALDPSLLCLDPDLDPDSEADARDFEYNLDLLAGEGGLDG